MSYSTKLEKKLTKPDKCVNKYFIGIYDRKVLTKLKIENIISTL